MTMLPPRLARKHSPPGTDHWRGYEGDLDVEYAYKLMFGKSIADLQEHFGGMSSIQRADELRFMPRRAFQYYVFAFAEFVVSDGAIGDDASASPFLNLLQSREQRDPGAVAEIYFDLAPYVDHVASNQELYDAPIHIYGSFPEQAEAIRALCSSIKHRSPKRGNKQRRQLRSRRRLTRRRVSQDEFD